MTRSHTVESHGGVSRSVRVRYQLTVVPSHIDHSIPQQDLHEQASQGKLPTIPSSAFTKLNLTLPPRRFAGSARKIFFRVHRRPRHQQGCEIHLMALHVSQPRAAKCVPAVSPIAHLSSCLARALHMHLPPTTNLHLPSHGLCAIGVFGGQIPLILAPTASLISLSRKIWLCISPQYHQLVVPFFHLCFLCHVISSHFKSFRCCYLDETLPPVLL